jgi:hypothetical protein
MAFFIICCNRTISLEKLVLTSTYVEVCICTGITKVQNFNAEFITIRPLDKKWTF